MAVCKCKPASALHRNSRSIPHWILEHLWSLTISTTALSTKSYRISIRGSCRDSPPDPSRILRIYNAQNCRVYSPGFCHISPGPQHSPRSCSILASRPIWAVDTVALCIAEFFFPYISSQNRHVVSTSILYPSIPHGVVIPFSFRLRAPFERHD
jgi:hypothetical protein